MEKQNRFKSVAMWTAVLGAVWVIAEATGLAAKIGIEKTTFTNVCDAVSSILVCFGILNNPTDPQSF